MHNIIKIAFAFLLCSMHIPQKGFSQQPNWNDTLQNIIASKINDSLKVSSLGKKIIYLATNARKESKDYLLAMESILANNKNPHLLSELYYSKAVVWNFTVPAEVTMGYIDSCLYFAHKAKNAEFLIRGYRMKGQYCERSGKFAEADANLQKAYELCKTINNPFETYRTLLALSNLRERQGDFKSYLEYALLAADVADKNPIITTQGSVYLRIAKGYQRNSDFQKSLEYYRKAEEYSIRAQQSILPELYSSLGTFYQTTKQYDDALSTYLKSDSVMQSQNNFTEATSVYSNLATLYTMRNELNSAKIYFEKSISIAEKTNNRYLGRMYLNYSNFLLKKGEDSLALAFSDKAIAEIKLKDDKEALSEAFQAKAEALIKLEEYQLGAQQYRQSISVKDSINELLKKESLGELLTKYETEKKENEIARLNSEKQIQQLQLEKQSALLAGNLLVAKQKQQEIDLLNQQQQIQELRISRQREALALKQLETEAKDRKIKLAQQENQLKESELIQQKFSKNLILAGSIILLAFVMLGFNQYRLHMHRKTDREKYLLENQLSEMKLEALRSQMNPHFIFNALNSINRYIIRSDKETASEYLIKFSKLIRMVLENSKSSTISLQSELEALNLYVQMELLRFDHKFDFNINIDETIKKEAVKIPPLVLQPFVENAIWHGLMNKKDRGSITIEVKPKDHNKLFVIIEDNGVGRQKANELKSRGNQNSKAFGMQITGERIKAMNNNDRNFRIIDLYDAENNSSGTRVEIELTTNAA